MKRQVRVVRQNKQLLQDEMPEKPGCSLSLARVPGGWTATDSHFCHVPDLDRGIRAPFLFSQRLMPNMNVVPVVDVLGCGWQY